MTPTTFTKAYQSSQTCAAAIWHYDWLEVCAAPLVLPAIHAAAADRIEFAYIDGRHALVDDLPALAAHLGDAHGAAWTTQLHRARLDRPYTATDGHRVADFITPRAGLFPAQTLHALARGPAAFYKDANLRNTLVTGPGAFTTIDFDELTLAPFGYDLAKLVVSLAMTYGSMPQAALRDAIERYNAATARHDRTLGRTSFGAFLAYTQIHGILTTPYLGRHGYTHPWRQPRHATAKGRQ